VYKLYRVSLNIIIIIIIIINVPCFKFSELYFRCLLLLTFKNTRAEFNLYYI
jgi:hypothetical protein